MVAPDHDRRPDLSAGDQLVELEPGPDALPVPQPANARRQSLEGDSLARHRQPAAQMIVLREQFQDSFIGCINILLVTRKRHPAERSLALAEQGANISRHKTGELERIAHAIVISL